MHLPPGPALGERLGPLRAGAARAGATRADPPELLRGTQSELIPGLFAAQKERIAPQSEVIRAIVLEGSPCCEVPHRRMRRPVGQTGLRAAARDGAAASRPPPVRGPGRKQGTPVSGWSRPLVSRIVGLDHAPVLAARSATKSAARS